ncbi:tail fiber assembly protein [Serratia marcescens]|uniref:Tail fiber assembly protein n=2 Tax=Serratia marcescens TaxID=615 RepID=A0ABD5BQK4_SERMA|nr:tail fiber assembly protein [Serratia marcescens]MDE5260651.1 tail fiber assembly protein [Serratia marcescens]MDQ9407405.1 tail fiber assembly protein [Serratia marcescens]MDQ9415437.1 tail fiber assembly protein [Serratia marcescens]MDQ9424914.1 tail fiber assembly protein [Serratia marcescens]MDQ9431604.1 tail fiber assembly protein [Serratia marcescens]
MSYGFSASTGAFYVYEDRASYEENGNWPADVKPVSEEVWQAYCGQGPAGKVRGADRKGLPCWVDAPPPTKSMLVAAAERKKAELLDVAGKAIAPLQDADDLAIATEEEAAQLRLWKTYRVQLNRINPQDAPETDWPLPPA